MVVEELLATLGVKVNVEEFLSAEGMIGKLKVALGAVAVGLGLHELKEMVHGVAEVGDAASKSSQKLGLTAEALQELGYAGKLADVSQGQLEGAMFRLSRGMEKVALHGKGPVADALKKLHIHFKELKGESLDANLERIADAFAAMPDGQQKAALAMQLFGGAGKAMIPLLNGGSAAIREQREEARKLGVVISDETAKKFEEFNDDQTRVSEAWRGMKIQIVSEMLPALQEMVTGLLEWIKSNREWIAVGFHVVLEVVIDVFKVLGAVVGEVVDFFRTLLTFLWEHKAVLEVLVGLILAALMPALLGLVVTLGALAAGFFVINAPLILLIALITSIVILVNHWGEIWPVVAAAAGKAWDFIKEKGMAFGSWVVGLPRAIVSAFANFGVMIGHAIGDAFDYLVDLAAKTSDRIWEKLRDTPLVGHLIRATEATVDFVSGSSPSALADQQKALDALGESQHRVESGPAGGVNASFETQVNVQTGPGLDEHAVAEITARKIAEAQRNMLGSAYDTAKGGQ